jgi:predicted phage gp36 major capsid-like protein
MVDEIVSRLSKNYLERIRELTEENTCLKRELHRAKKGARANTREADRNIEAGLDMDKILRPDENLNLENLCKELGLMDDNA